MKLQMNFLPLILVLLASAANAAAELKTGRYIGWINLTERAERIAVTADIFVESPEDYTKFPTLNAILHLGLGGYKTHEYLTQKFTNLKYDFDNGRLTFGEDGTDLLMSTTISLAGGRTKVAGDVFVRSSAVRGTIELLEESDEPEDLMLSLTGLGSPSSNQFVPLLDGQYEGMCDGKESVLQVLTVRGMKTEQQGGNEQSLGLEREYGISGRIGYRNDPTCGNIPKGNWCARFTFSGGAYNFYLGKLNFQGKQSTESCSIKGAEVKCNIKTMDKVISCAFKKPNISNKNSAFFPRKFHVQTKADQIENLPDPEPPTNAALSAALKGTFSGFLHNESNDQYIPINLDVFPFSSTDNPHNPNQMMVSATASMFFGDSFITQRFDPRSFYLRPGFSLSGPTADSFISILEWKTGYIRGIWYSHAFGKVGTLQLVKGRAPTLPGAARVTPTFAGDYGRKFSSTIDQWLRFIFPTQPTDLQNHLIRFTGSYQSIVGNTPIRDIPSGIYDPYTGRLGWIIEGGETQIFGSGVMEVNGNAQVYWPPIPLFGVRTPDYKFSEFKRKP